MLFQQTAPGLDDLLLDVVTVIELGDHDREVADSRYRRLKVHIERPSSPLREYLLNNSLIYAQGSMAIGATIVSGTDDDRFDVDALVEFTVPATWSGDEALNKLDESLQGFPGVHNIVRCTRCVQLQFAFMHMDVTILDPASEPRAERVGDIFHSPDEGDSYRVPSNPFGFAKWYRSSVQYASAEFVESLHERRSFYGVNRLSMSAVEKAEQENLPPVVPPRFDAQQVLALKLMKRFLNLRYEGRTSKRPPSIYLTKLSHDCGFASEGLTAQLERFAGAIKSQMEIAYRMNEGPDERNPSFLKDRLNDRWPTAQYERKTLIDDMSSLLESLRRARQADFKQVARIISELFGERVSSRTVANFMQRQDKRLERKSMNFERGTGAAIGSVATAAPVVARTAASVPRHTFHTGRVPDDQ